jgi:chemotaxis response regulator CheB
LQQDSSVSIRLPRAPSARAPAQNQREGSSVANEQFAVAIGASAGGIEALLQIAAALPRGFPALVLVTQHVGNLPSMLPELLRARGPHPAIHPLGGEPALPGTIYVAPPDRHMLLVDGRIRLSRGPKENHSRPAIDPMFRSVAHAMRERAIGVVLTGQLGDGTAGLQAIKRCGGTAIVQDPATALEPSMPASALANVQVDLCLHLDEVVPAIERIIGTAGPGPAVVPGGNAQHSLRSDVRALREREDLLRRAARLARAHGDHAQAEAGERRAEDARARADALVRIIERKERGA